MASTTFSDISQLFNVEGTVVVVTGGGTGMFSTSRPLVDGLVCIVLTTSLFLSGIGLMIATTLENHGAIVYIVGRRAEVLEKAIRERSVRLFCQIWSCSSY